MIVVYSRIERAVLGGAAALGLVGVNGVFLYAVLTRPELIEETLSNPLAAAFVVEAGLLVAVLAYLLAKWGVTRLSWGWFVLASLAGSLLFALPFAALWRSGAHGGGAAQR